MCSEVSEGDGTLSAFPTDATTSVKPTSENGEHLCTTQSLQGSEGFNSLELFDASSPTLQKAETAAPPAYPSHSNTTPATAPQTYSFPEGYPTAPSTDSMWLTPPAIACEDFDDYTYNRSPASPSCDIPPIASFPAQSYTASPRSYPSPDASSFGLQDTVWKGLEHIYPYNMTMHTDRTLVSSPHCGNTAYVGNNIDHDSVLNDAPGLSPDHQAAAISRSASPGRLDDFGSPYPLQEDPMALILGKEEAVSAGEEANKADEPYAKLIYRAFMSRERHAMTLQEIYAWFRDNTDKAKADNKGWQNSIRHNLSMNRAFVKRDKQPLPDQANMESAEVKKSTEWVLEEWAVRGGVQSTTRYRKGNPSRRAGPGAYSRHGYPPSARGSSGRKGGLMASKTKAAAHRSLRHEPQQYESILPNALLAQHHGGNLGFYSRTSLTNVDCISAARDEPVTPPDVSAGSFSFPDDELAAHLARSTDNRPGYYYARGLASQPNYHLYHHPQAHQYPAQQQYPTQSQTILQNYRLEDVTGIYHSQHPALSSTGTFDQHGQQPHASLHHLSSGYSVPFTEQISQSSNDVSGPPLRDANHTFHWDPSDNGPYSL